MPESIKFSDVAKHLEYLEKTQSRNEMVGILERLFLKVTVHDIDKVCYLVLGQIDAGYKGKTLGLGEKMVSKSISIASSLSNKEVESMFRKKGDLGLVAEKASKSSGTLDRFTREDKDVSVKEVFEKLHKIAGSEGEGSQNKRTRTLAGLISKTSSLGARYIIRIALGELRLGLGKMTVLDALTVTFVGKKERRPKVEHAYNICSDIGLVALKLYKKGLKGVEDIGVKVGRPIRMMLAQRLNDLSDLTEKIGDKFAVEEKYDGERMQIHKTGKKISIFSRRLEDITHQYPDVVKYIKDEIDAESVIVEGEAVAIKDGELQNFQTLMRRKRKYDIEEFVQKIPVKIFLFDILYLDGNECMSKSYPDRRSILEDAVDTTKNLVFSKQEVISSLDDIEDFFDKAIQRGNEGIIIKSCSEDSIYRAGAREWLWIKWKKDYSTKMSDAVDLVIIGGFAGKGRRSGMYGALLCAIYNKNRDMFETICKVGTGFTDEVLEKLPNKLSKFKVNHEPARVDSKIEPTQWFQPGVVIEVLGAELTRSPVHTAGREYSDGEGGIAIRFPRFLNFRVDKSPEDCTSVSEIVGMFNKSK